MGRAHVLSCVLSRMGRAHVLSCVLSCVLSRMGRAHVLVDHHADPIGHLLGLLSGARPRFRDGCYLYVSDRGLAHLVLTRRGFSAITLGHVIVASREPSEAIWRHELRHVRQYERLGLAFLPLYLRLHTRHGYASHPLEREADGAVSLFDWRGAAAVTSPKAGDQG